MKAVFFKLVFIVLVQWTAKSQNTELTPTKTSPLDSVLTEDLKQKTLDASGDSNELSLLFIGDFMGHLDQINAAYDKVSGSYNYDSTFKKITPILSDADVTIGNLENQ